MFGMTSIRGFTYFKFLKKFHTVTIFNTENVLYRHLKISAVADAKSNLKCCYYLYLIITTYFNFMTGMCVFA